ncbi:hypothetical protein CTI12_AA066900 [Artemisia annua]|uniref:Uncharacterized protein n=1 Tax=Artemisia annua TaxID=35608 RepID=A0A2U1NQ91_ARTAN|nr:hypothetical protein CTI12_AA066900 [Artemisia annua]
MTNWIILEEHERNKIKQAATFISHFCRERRVQEEGRSWAFIIIEGVSIKGIFWYEGGRSRCDREGDRDGLTEFAMDILVDRMMIVLCAPKFYDALLSVSEVPVFALKKTLTSPTFFTKMTRQCYFNPSLTVIWKQNIVSFVIKKQN